MFKKSLLALAVAGATLTANAAVIETVTSTATKNIPEAISNQGLPVTGEYNLTTALEVTFSAAEAAALVDGNFLAVSIEGAYFADYEVNGGPSLDDDDTYGAIGTQTDDATVVVGGLVALPVNDVTLSKIPLSSSRASTASKLYLAFNGDVTTNAAAGEVTNGVDDPSIATTFIFNDLNLQVIPGATSITMSVAVESESGIAIPSVGSVSNTIATMQDQWSIAITGLAAKIDVANDRETFVVKTGTTATTDTMVLNYTKNGSGATVASYKVTINGDFTGVASVGTGYTINTAMTKATKTVAADITSSSDETLTFTLEAGDDAVSQTERTFNADIEVTYDTSKTFDLATAKAAGGWTLNSSSMTMNYVPMGPNTQVIVNATSVFDEDASVDVSYLAADGTMELLTDIATVAPGVVTKLGNAISDAILADMGTTSAKTKITVSVNAPEGNVTFFTGFSNISDGSRMGLEQTTTTEADAAAIRSDLANTTDGLGELSSDIAAGNLTSTNATTQADVADLVAQVVAQSSGLLEDATAGDYEAGAMAVINAICGNITVAGVPYVLTDSTGTLGAWDIADADTAAVTDVCGVAD